MSAPRDPSTDRPLHCPRNHSCLSPEHHDTLTGYKRGCRSRSATIANTRAMQKRRRSGIRLVNSVGTARRLQALAALGYTYPEIGQRLLITPSAVQRHATGHYRRVHPESAARVHELYIEWSETEPPEHWTRLRMRRRAVKLGWLGPDAWDDVTIDDPNATPWSFSADYTSDVAMLTELGLSASKIALRLGISQRQVVRYRAKLAAQDAA